MLFSVLEKAIILHLTIMSNINVKQTCQLKQQI